MGVIGTTIGELKDYHRDPFPHSLLGSRQSSEGAVEGISAWGNVGA